MGRHQKIVCSSQVAKMKLLIVSCLIAVAAAAPQVYHAPVVAAAYHPAAVPIVSETNDIAPDGSFSYSYATGDGQHQTAQGYLRNAGTDAESEVHQGSYSYTSPEGTPITVNWIADEFGFRAEGAHIPQAHPPAARAVVAAPAAAIVHHY